MDNVMTANAELAAAIREWWSPVFYSTLLAGLPMAAVVARDYEGNIQDLGDTVNVTQIPEFDEADDISEDQRVDANAVNLTGIALVINHYYAKDFILTKKGQKQSLQVIDTLRQMAIYSVMKKMQSDIFAATVPSASAPDHQIAYDSGTTLALADILEGKELLDDANVPETGRHMITDSAQYNDLFNITGFTSRDYVPGSNAMSSGAITTPILGFQFNWTTESADVTRLFHESFMQVAMQTQPNVMVYDQGGQGLRSNRYNVDCLVGIKQFSNVRCVELS